VGYTPVTVWYRSGVGGPQGRRRPDNPSKVHCAKSAERLLDAVDAELSYG
jgi:hypothetical protein